MPGSIVGPAGAQPPSRDVFGDVNSDVWAERDVVARFAQASTWLIDAAVAVSTLMLVALGDKPARRARTVTTSTSAETQPTKRLGQPPGQGAKALVKRLAPNALTQTAQPDRAQTVQDATQTNATQADGEIALVDADLASELIASGVTTQPIETVTAVLAASRNGASINAAAKASGINYRTAQRIVEAAAGPRQRQLVVVG